MDGALGLDRLVESLQAAGAGGLTLPGVDDPTSAPSYMRQVLELGRERGLDFESAWAAGFTRIQAPQDAGVINGFEAAMVREERALLEEVRPLWQAAYERREPLALERGIVRKRSWDRLHPH